MMKYIYLYLILILIVVVACEDVVEVELNENDIDLFSVEANINTKSTNNIFVKLEKSLPVTKTEQNPAVNNAIIEISDNQTPANKVFLSEEGNSGIYTLPKNDIYPAIAGRTYKLTITTSDGTVITSEEYLQKVEPLDTMHINLSARGNFEFLAIYINTQETPGPGHYYKWNIYKNGVLLSDADQMTFINDELVDGNYIYDFEIFTDFTNPHDEVENDGILQMGDQIYVEQLSISRNAYDFYYLLVNQAFSGSPFSVPPANLPGNLTSDNGKRVLGLFSATDISVSNSVVINSTNYIPLTPSIGTLN